MAAAVSRKLAEKLSEAARPEDPHFIVPFPMLRFVGPDGGLIGTGESGQVQRRRVAVVDARAYRRAAGANHIVAARRVDVQRVTRNVVGGLEGSQNETISIVVRPIIKIVVG